MTDTPIPISVAAVCPQIIGLRMDQFKELPVTLTSPATSAVDIVPNDSIPLSIVTRAVYVAHAGDLSVEMQSGQIVTFQNVQDGSILAIRTLKVRQAGTTATGIVAMW
jgi:hypothetical protein